MGGKLKRPVAHTHMIKAELHPGKHIDEFFFFLLQAKLGHNEMTVKFRQHTRLVNVPVEQNSDWLNSLKVAVVNRFRDLLSPDGKEAELIFEKMKNNLLFQVYNVDHEEYVDLTNDTMLTEKAKLRLQMTPMALGEPDGTAPSIRELVSLLICITLSHIVIFITFPRRI